MSPASFVAPTAVDIWGVRYSLRKSADMLHRWGSCSCCSWHKFHFILQICNRT